MDAEERPRPPGLGRVGAGVFGVEMDDGGKNSHCPWKNCHKNVLRGEKIVLRWEIKSPSQREFKMSFSEGKIIPKNPFARGKSPRPWPRGRTDAVWRRPPARLVSLAGGGRAAPCLEKAARTSTSTVVYYVHGRPPPAPRLRWWLVGGADRGQAVGGALGGGRAGDGVRGAAGVRGRQSRDALRPGALWACRHPHGRV